MNKRILIWAIGAVLLCGAFAIFWGESEPPSNPTTALSVTIVRPQSGGIAETISATGVTIPREEIQIMTELSGVKVRDLLVDVGETVRKGQVLAVLDGESFENQLAQLESNYDKAQEDLQRLNALKDIGGATEQSVTEARAAMLTAKASLDNGRLDVRRSTILAPADGVVFERNAVIGGLVTESEPLFRIARRDEIELEVMVPEARLSDLRIGNPASVTLTGESRPIAGTIRLITPRIDSATRMAAIRIGLPNQTPIPVGLFGTAQIMHSQRKGMLLPKTAIQQDHAGEFVWGLSAESKAERLPLKVVLTDGEKVMVESISPDIRVVARAGAFIKEGDRVNVVGDR
jgi:HlyD family secretion protein